MKLLPCPFCGCKMSGRTEYEFAGDSFGACVHVVCKNCSARGPSSSEHDGEYKATVEARKLWNERDAARKQT